MEVAPALLAKVVLRCRFRVHDTNTTAMLPDLAHVALNEETARLFHRRVRSRQRIRWLALAHRSWGFRERNWRPGIFLAPTQAARYLLFLAVAVAVPVACWYRLRFGIPWSRILTSCLPSLPRSRLRTIHVVFGQGSRCKRGVTNVRALRRSVEAAGGVRGGGAAVCCAHSLGVRVTSPGTSPR